MAKSLSVLEVVFIIEFFGGKFEIFRKQKSDSWEVVPFFPVFYCIENFVLFGTINVGIRILVTDPQLFIV